jgi:hypothetical protein
LSWRCVEGEGLSASLPSHTIRVICGKVAGTPSVLDEDGITVHTAYNVRLDTISVIEAISSGILIRSHGFMIRSYVSSHISP